MVANFSNYFIDMKKVLLNKAGIYYFNTYTCNKNSVKKFNPKEKMNRIY